MPEGRLQSILRDMQRANVRFILVGGLAAVLRGAPIHTYDVDVVYARDTTNVSNLLTFLHETDAIFRIQPERRLRPNETHLAGAGHLNLLTRFGPLDLLASIGDPGMTFDDLIAKSGSMEIDDGIFIRVLDLETIIAVKERLASAKDLAVLPLLRQTLNEITRRNS